MAIQAQLNWQSISLSKVSLKNFYISLTVFNVLFFSALYFFVPALRSSLIQEDEFLENLTTIFCIDVFLLGLLFIARLRQKQAWKIYGIIPILGLLAALDELSFGERIFRFQAPELGSTKIDALHDIFDFLVEFLTLAWNRMPKRQNYVLFAIVGAIACLLLFGLWWAIQNRQQVAMMARQSIRRLVSFVRLHPPFGFLAIAITYTVITLVLDLDLIRSDFMSFLEELLEMNAALTLLFASFAIRRSQFIQPARRSAYRLT